LNPYATSIIWSTFVGDAKPDASDAVFFTGPIQLDGPGTSISSGRLEEHRDSPWSIPLSQLHRRGSAGVDRRTRPHRLEVAVLHNIGSHGLNTIIQPGWPSIPPATSTWLAIVTAGPDHDPWRIPDDLQQQPCCRHGFVAKIAPTNPQITAVNRRRGLPAGHLAWRLDCHLGRQPVVLYAAVANERDRQRQAAHAVGWSQRDRRRKARGGVLHQPRPTRRAGAGRLHHRLRSGGGHCSARHGHGHSHDADRLPGLFMYNTATGIT